MHVLTPHCVFIKVSIIIITLAKLAILYISINHDEKSFAMTVSETFLYR
jgi:hypothetical protein